MSVETTAALYGAIAGAVATGVVTGIISVTKYLLSRRGGVELIPSYWRFAYLVFLEDPERNRPEYRLYEPSYPFEYEGEPHEAIYAFTADLINKMDVADILRDVSVAFMRNGEVMFTHRPESGFARCDTRSIIHTSFSDTDPSSQAGKHRPLANLLVIVK